MITVLLENVDFKLNLFLFVFGDIHDLDRSQLAGLGVSALVHLTVRAIADDFDELENTCEDWPVG